MQWEETLIAILTSICFTTMILSLKKLGICQNMKNLKNLKEYSLALKNLRRIFNHHRNQLIKLQRLKLLKNNNHLLLKAINNQDLKILYLSQVIQINYLDLKVYHFQFLFHFQQFPHKAVFLCLKE